MYQVFLAFRHFQIHDAEMMAILKMKIPGEPHHDECSNKRYGKSQAKGDADQFWIHAAGFK
jgi:hypothetical protein